MPFNAKTAGQYSVAQLPWGFALAFWFSDAFLPHASHSHSHASCFTLAFSVASRSHIALAYFTLMKFKKKKCVSITLKCPETHKIETRARVPILNLCITSQSSTSQSLIWSVHRYTLTRLDTVIFIQCGLIWFHAKLAYLPVTQDAKNVYSVKSVYPSPWSVSTTSCQVSCRFGDWTKTVGARAEGYTQIDRNPERQINRPVLII